MKTSYLAFVLLAVGVAGCSPRTTTPPTSSPDAAASPKIKGLPVTLAVKQRSTTIVPGTDGELSITADDITRGQVMVSLVSKNGNALFGPVSMKRGEPKQFQFFNATYSIKIVELNNALVGEDFASFVISEPSAETLSEDQKIERLIASVESLDGAVFIRNGAEYSANEAADHLRQKLEAADDQITSAAEFVDLVASQSSLTGDEYKIRMSDGELLRTQDFLYDELAKLESSR